MSAVKRNCDNCGKPYEADSRNLKRGWGLCCSKACAASKREKSRPGYHPLTVAINNTRRANWNVPQGESDHPYSAYSLGQWDDTW